MTDDDPSPLVDIKVGPYTTGRYTQCVEHSWTSAEHATPSAAALAYAKHLREKHAPPRRDAPSP